IRHIVQDLLFEALLDDRGWSLAGPEPGNPHLARVEPRVPLDFRVDDVTRNLDADVFSCVVDVNELGLHGYRVWFAGWRQAPLHRDSCCWSVAAGSVVRAVARRQDAGAKAG